MQSGYFPSPHSDQEDCAGLHSKKLAQACDKLVQGCRIMYKNTCKLAQACGKLTKTVISRFKFAQGCCKLATSLWQAVILVWDIHCIWHVTNVVCSGKRVELGYNTLG